MFLHLVDDEKFTDGGISLFEACDPGNHRYIFICNEEKRSFRYIKSGHVHCISKTSGEYLELLNTLPEYTAVFLHGLFKPYYIELVNTASPKTVFVWIFWGGELLKIKRYRNSLLLPRTRLLLLKNKVMPWLETNWEKYTHMIRYGQIEPLRRSLTQAIKPEKRAMSHNESVDFIAAIERMDYIIPIIEDDFRLLQKTFSIKARMLRWSYNAGTALENIKIDQVHKVNWLVGNSAHYTNNHIEIFQKLNRIREFEGKVIAPLSYGEPLYREAIIQIGKRYWKEKFFPLVEFLPLEDYCNLIRTCSCAFFNTRRQQATGNIGLLLSFGTKVFLREENPVFHFLRRNGAIIFSIQKDIPREVTTNMPLDDASVHHNRDIVRQLTSNEVIWKKTQTMLAILKENA